jgi:hypothetical protein
MAMLMLVMDWKHWEGDGEPGAAGEQSEILKS